MVTWFRTIAIISESGEEITEADEYMAIYSTSSGTYLPLGLN